MSFNNYTNIAEYLVETAQRFPDRRAVIFPYTRDRRGRVAYTHLTFAQLNRLSDAYAHAFSRAGITRGVKTLLLLKPSLEFMAAVFAVFKTGAVPVLIDPGMGKENLLNCIQATAPEALLAMARVHWLKLGFPTAFRSVRIRFSLGAFPPPGTGRLEKIEATAEAFPIEKTSRAEMAAILFTTGSTGPPKGVVYTHEIFIAQTEIIRTEYGAGPEHLDLPAFPLFALFSAALGMTCVIPEMDPSRPARVNPERIVEAVKNQGVSFSFGSPALWRVVAEYCLANNIRLTSLKKVLMAGAPVSAEVHGQIKKIIAADGETVIPYGATEALPIATFTGREMLDDTAEKTRNGHGYCVGRPVRGLTLKVIKATVGPIENWDERLVLPGGEIGEIVVKGPVVTPAYYQQPDPTKMAKIRDADGRLWHRLGDVGYFDDQGRLWFCGRQAHRVITAGTIYYPVCCEAIFNRHPAVFRSALVGVARQGGIRPVLVVELRRHEGQRTSRAPEQLVAELKELGRQKPFTADIEAFLFHPDFPVDVRHNAKINREKLAAWAQKQNS